MWKYLCISFILFGLLFIGIKVALICLGGETIVPLAFQVPMIIILINTGVAIILFVVQMIRGKI